MKTNHLFQTLSYFSLGAIFLLSSCRQQSITSVWVDKEIQTATMPMQAGLDSPEASENPLHWMIPETWQEVAASNMRVASFRDGQSPASDLDISVVRLSGNGGGNLANVNRWRGQLGLAPIDETQLNKDAKKWEVDHHAMLMVDYTGSGEARMVAAIYSLDQESWFFKMTGKNSFVEKNKAKFSQFLNSIKTSHAH